MIKLFRSIRQNLLAEGKTSRYLKYAIGEIILVVIGILIALSINNWNSNRKSRILEITLLKNLKEDITLDTLDMGFNVLYHKQTLSEEIKLLTFLKSDLQKPLDSINYNNALGLPLLAILHRSTFNNLQNNDIGIITNNQLMKDISRFYDFFNMALQKMENEKIAYDTYSLKKTYFFKNFQLLNEDSENSNKKFNSSEYYNPDFISDAIVPIDLLALKNDQEFKMILSQSISFSKVKIDFYNDMLNRIKELSKEIDKELNTLNN